MATLLGSTTVADSGVPARRCGNPLSPRTCGSRRRRTTRCGRPPSSAAAEPGGAPVKGEQLAQSQGIPQNFLENILTELRRAGLVRTRRGADGGYELARPASEITVADVLARGRGAARGGAGHPARGARRTTGAAAHLPEVWVALRASLRGVLEQDDARRSRRRHTSRVAVTAKTADPDAWPPR